MLAAVLALSVGLSAVLGAPAEPDHDKGQVWAVLVAGSSGFGNYRHQADICHAYQILHRHGIPDSNIIVMMYDDIANNDENPHKGVIINKPGGPNVYKHVPKDYTGDDVTPENFVHVLTGNKKALNGAGSGKVLKSGPNDHVFINFVDHGAVGIIGFPNGEIYADTLIKALKTMHQKKMYKKLVFYLEACESGSMFQGILPKNINIFATTAANPSESSWGCYCYSPLQTCLGDHYSVSWMEDVDANDKNKHFPKETLLDQFHSVVKRVNDSHPCKYGTQSLGKDLLKHYMGPNSKTLSFDMDYDSTKVELEETVSSRDVPVFILYRKIQLAEDDDVKEELRSQLSELIQGREDIDLLFKRVLAHVTKLKVEDFETIQSSRPTLRLDMMPCYRTLVDGFSKNCVNINKNTYALVHLYKLANLCIMEYPTEDVLEAFSTECDEHTRALEGVN